MKDVKLIVTDLDSTVLRTDKSISQYTHDIFQKCREHGIFTAIATARYYMTTEQFSNILKPDYEITAEGTMTYKKGKFICGCSFDVSTANNIIQEILTKNANCPFSVATESGIYQNIRCMPKPPVSKVKDYDFTNKLSECVYKIGAILPEQCLAEAITEKYDCKMTVYRDKDTIGYGFTNKNSGKIQAIMNLAEILQISLSDIMAFGDEMNDIEMLEQCGYGIAVANALDKVKEKAKYLTDSNDEDGVAKFIDKNLF